MKKILKWGLAITFFPITLSVMAFKRMSMFNKLHPNYKAKDILTQEERKILNQGTALFLLAICSWIFVFVVSISSSEETRPQPQNQIVEEVEDLASKKYSGLTIEQEQLFDKTLKEKINGEVDLNDVVVEFQIFEDGSGLGGTYSYVFKNSRGLKEFKVGLLTFNLEMTEVLTNELNVFNYQLSSSLESDIKTTCKDLIEQTLVAPSTAKFPGVFDDGWIFTIDENQNVTIITYVDAQNSFGAMIRTYYELYADLDTQIVTIINAE